FVVLRIRLCFLRWHHSRLLTRRAAKSYAGPRRCVRQQDLLAHEPLNRLSCLPSRFAQLSPVLYSQISEEEGHPMTSKTTYKVTALAARIALLLPPAGVRVLEVKKHLGRRGGGGGPSSGGGGGGGPAPANPIPKAMQQQLMQTVTDDSEPFLNQESEKK